MFLLFFFFKQKTAYEMRISDWSSDVCSSDLLQGAQPSAGEIAIIGAGRVTESVRRLAQRWPQGRSRCYGAQHQVTVPGYIFGAGKNGQIDAMADGPEIERRRPGIVHQRHDSPCLEIGRAHV